MQLAMKRKNKNMTVRIRFPNESLHEEFSSTTFNIKEFKVDEKYIFDDEVFGWWGDMYVAVNKKDYDELTKDK